MIISESEILEYRKAFYDSEKGYIVLKNYLSQEDVQHLQHFWKKDPPNPSYFDTVPTERKQIGQRAFAFFGHRRTCYYNYIWNKPLDTLTIPFVLMWLSSETSNHYKQSPYLNLIPSEKRLASYRVILSQDICGR